jgi:hypothetical protein
MSGRPTFVVTRYDTYASFEPSFSLIGDVTVQSRVPSPTPARSNASAFLPSWPPLPCLSNGAFGLPEPASSASPLGLRVVEALPWAAGLFCHETLAKSLCSILIVDLCGAVGGCEKLEVCWSRIGGGCYMGVYECLCVIFHWNYRTQTTKRRAGEFEAQAGVARKADADVIEATRRQQCLRQARTTTLC